MGYTEEVAFVPGSASEPTHASHLPAPSLTAGARTPYGAALASAAIGQALRTLASHKPLSKKLPFWF